VKSINDFWLTRVKLPQPGMAIDYDQKADEKTSLVASPADAPQGRRQIESTGPAETQN
jgi:hypothetical protein